jgi:hypothetical protein
MSAQKITASQAKLANWAETRALDKIARPMWETVGVGEAYRIAMESGEPGSDIQCDAVSTGRHRPLIPR